MERSEIWNQLEACRLDRDDLLAPERESVRQHLSEDGQLRRQFDQAQAADRRVRESMLNPPTPAGMQDRLLAMLDDADAASAQATAIDVPSKVEASVGLASAAEANTVESSGTGRRWWLVSTLSLAATLLIAALLIGPGATPALDANQVSQDAIAFHRDFDASRPWLSMKQAAPLVPARQLEQRLFTGWLAADELFGRATGGVAYRLRGADGLSATLYTIEGGIDELPSGPVAAQAVRTGGLWAAAWQSDDQIFVLVIPTRDPNAFRQFLPNRGSLAGDWLIPADRLAG